MMNVQNLVGGYTNFPIINGLNLTIQSGEFFALLGPNGSGKTTLFKLITGQLSKISGEILLDDKEISSYSKLEKAKKVAVLTQEVQVSFDYTVEEIVSLGRYPHQKGMIKKLSKKDWAIVEEVMDITKVSKFRKKQFRTISGGEKQRVLLAKALAQEPEFLLLDEPTNHLDIKHTFQILDLLKERQQRTGLTIFSILHDLNVASLYADRVALLHNGNLLEVGNVDLLRKEDQLQKVYQVQVNAQSHPKVPKPQLLMTPNYKAQCQDATFYDSYQIHRKPELTQIEFCKPLRTISNAPIGDGINWMKHFCVAPSLEKLEEFEIPAQQVVGMESCAGVEILKETFGAIEMMAVVASDLKGKTNVMLFMNAHFTDGALVNGLMCVTEAVLREQQQFGDTILLGLTQQGAKFTSIDSQTKEAIREMVSRAIRKKVYY